MIGRYVVEGREMGREGRWGGVGGKDGGGRVRAESYL